MRAGWAAGLLLVLPLSACLDDPVAPTSFTIQRLNDRAAARYEIEDEISKKRWSLVVKLEPVQATDPMLGWPAPGHRVSLDLAPPPSIEERTAPLGALRNRAFTTDDCLKPWWGSDRTWESNETTLYAGDAPPFLLLANHTFNLGDAPGSFEWGPLVASVVLNQTSAESHVRVELSSLPFHGEGTVWRLIYQDRAPFPVKMRIRSHSGGIVNATLIEWTNDGAPVGPCPTGEPEYAVAPLVPVGFGPSLPPDPPLPLSLWQAVLWAESDPTLTTLAQMKALGPVHLRRWKYESEPPEPGLVEGAWRMWATTEDGAHGAEILCRKFDTPDSEPPNRGLWRCTDDFTIGIVWRPGLKVFAPAMPFHVWQTIAGEEVCGYDFRIAEDAANSTMRVSGCSGHAVMTMGAEEWGLRRLEGDALIAKAIRPA